MSGLRSRAFRKAALCLIQGAEFEADQTVIEMQGVGVGVSVDEAAINTGRFGVFFALEVDESEEVQDTLIGRPHAPRRFELAFRDREVASLEILHAAVEMDKEQPLVEWSRCTVCHRSLRPANPINLVRALEARIQHRTVVSW